MEKAQRMPRGRLVDKDSKCILFIPKLLEIPWSHSEIIRVILKGNIRLINSQRNFCIHSVTLVNFWYDLRFCSIHYPYQIAYLFISFYYYCLSILSKYLYLSLVNCDDTGKWIRSSNSFYTHSLCIKSQ
jgi:hypothetical protein